MYLYSAVLSIDAGGLGLGLQRRYKCKAQRLEKMVSEYSPHGDTMHFFSLGRKLFRELHELALSYAVSFSPLLGLMFWSYRLRFVVMFDFC
jgi:hypothetical protein